MNCYEDLMYRGLIKDFSADELKDKLNNESITFYIGTDPTADSMHIGHYSSFLIAKRLKDSGHNPILLIGGATGLIGDPKPDSERSIIKKEVAEANALALTKQAHDLFGFTVVNNYDWSKDINFIDYLRDYGKYFTINMMLEKDIVKRRLESGITYTEFSYMIMQALDFHYLFKTYDCKMQIAGSDQWGNITAGIDLIRKKEQDSAYGFTMPLITDKYGNKFGKSEGNALWLDKNKTSSYEMYQYLFNSSDDMVLEYLKKLTLLKKEEIDAIMREHENSPEKRHAQEMLAKEVITFIHSEEDYKNAKKISEYLFSENIIKLTLDEIKDALKEVPSFLVEESEITINELLTKYNICSSKREVREMITDLAISINNKKISDYDFLVNKTVAIEDKLLVIKKGKKKYYLGFYK